MAIGSTEQYNTGNGSRSVDRYDNNCGCYKRQLCRIRQATKNPHLPIRGDLAPTVNEGTVEGGFQVNGASGAENNFIVDGISTTSLIQGNSRQNTAFEFLEQVQIKTSGIEAQYGGATGWCDQRDHEIGRQ